MTKKNFIFYFLITTLFTTLSCNLDQEEELNLSENGKSQTTKDITSKETSNGCLNVVIINGYAYAACDNVITIVSLTTGEQNTVSIAADDITSDAEHRLLFVQSGNVVRMLTVASDPINPRELDSETANFRSFSGISAANGVLVVSGGGRGANTTVYNYTNTTLRPVINGIPTVDNRTGAPDIHLTSRKRGALAFYSQDLGGVANFGIQIIEFNNTPAITNIRDVVVLASGQFNGSFGAPFGPANFPVESEFLGNNLYVANFAAQGIEVIDVNDNAVIGRIPLPYEPTNIGTDGELLFVVGVAHDDVDVIDPITFKVVDTFNEKLKQPTGIAANSTHIAIADRRLGLIIVRR